MHTQPVQVRLTKTGEGRYSLAPVPFAFGTALGSMLPSLVSVGVGSSLWYFTGKNQLFMIWLCMGICMLVLLPPLFAGIQFIEHQNGPYLVTDTLARAFELPRQRLTIPFRDVRGIWMISRSQRFRIRRHTKHRRLQLMILTNAPQPTLVAVMWYGAFPWQSIDFLTEISKLSGVPSSASPIPIHGDYTRTISDEFTPTTPLCTVNELLNAVNAQTSR